MWNESQEQWEHSVKYVMEEAGWTLDKDDAECLGFSFYQEDRHWIRDYCKKERNFVQYDGNQMVKLREKKEVK